MPCTYLSQTVLLCLQQLVVLLEHFQLLLTASVGRPHHGVHLRELSLQLVHRWHNTTHTVSLLQQHILFSSYIIILRIHCMIMCNVWIFMHVIITWIKWLEILIKYTRILYKQFSKILGYICTIFNIRLRIVLHHSRQTITINTMDLSNQIWLETMLK